MMSSKNNGSSTASLFSWAFYDWANSAFFAVIQTFVFAIYFTDSVALNETMGSVQWGNTIGAAGLFIAIAGPVLGAIADQFGRRKPWIVGFSSLCIIATAALWFVRPSTDFVFLALVLVFIGTVGSECAIIFYNVMLPDLASGKKVGRWSGWAWGMGYAGGLACLLVVLYGFIKVDVAPFGLDTNTSEPVRFTFIVVAFWYLIFSLPLFFITPDAPRTNVVFTEAISNSWHQLRESIQNIKRYRHILWFLAARMIFIDALATVFAFGGIYAQGTFHMLPSDVLIFGVGLNLTAGIGAILFAWIDDWLGSRRTMLFCLIALIVLTTAVLLVSSRQWFWVYGLALGIFVGPVQAASRTYMARVAPDHLRNQMFGLLALSGKVTAFIGPFLVGWLTYIFDSQRIGMSVIVIMFLIGFLLLLRVPDALQKATS